MKQSKFAPKIGGAVISSLVAGVAIVGWQIIHADSAGQRTGLALGSLAILVYGIGIVWWLGWPIEYRLDDHFLIIQTGKIEKTIKLDTILSASYCINFSLAKTWSFSRIRINYKYAGTNQTIYIAPKDRSGFLKALSEASPEIILTGESVEREKSLGSKSVEYNK